MHVSFPRKKIGFDSLVPHCEFCNTEMMYYGEVVMKMNWVLLGVFMGVLFISAGKSFSKTPYYICDPNDLGIYLEKVFSGEIDPNTTEAVQDPNCITDIQRFQEFVINVYPKRDPYGKRKLINRSELNAPDGAIGGVFGIHQNHTMQLDRRYNYTYVVSEEQLDGSYKMLSSVNWTVAKAPIGGMKAFAEFAKTWGTNP